MFRINDYEQLLNRIELRAREIAEKLEPVDGVNILRSFSRILQNKMWGSEKTYTDLEPTFLKNMDKIEPKDLTNLMYAYGIRKDGNPEIYEAFDKRLLEVADQLDH